MNSIPQRLLGEALEYSAKKHSSKTAIIVKDTEYSYTFINESAKKLANYLVLKGIKKGDRIAVYMNNSMETTISIYGITMAGGVFLAINPQTKADKLQYILNDSEAKILLSESMLINEFSKVLDNVKDIQEIIISGDNKQLQNQTNKVISILETIIEEKQTEVSLPKIIPNDLAALIYTSGSTGFPKGVMMTHQSMVFTTWSLIEYLRLTDEDRILLLLPMAFDYGLYQLLMAITIGGSLIIEQSFTFQATIFKQIEKHKPTVFPGVPTIYAMLIATHKKSGVSFNGIKKITNTAAALPADIIPSLKKIFPEALIFKMYGLTECKRVCYLEPELIDSKTSSVGKAIPGTEIFLLSPEGKPVAPEERGILHIRGPHIMQGYWHKKELSKEMLKQGSLPWERVLCSNDWFKMDKEGFFYFLGRADDIIKTRGEKVSPIEVENVIYKINGIKEVAVIGIPDEIMGEAIVAFITSHSNLKMTEKEIQRECMLKLELFMVPKHIIFLDEMPKSTNGKIDKKELKKINIPNG